MKKLFLLTFFLILSSFAFAQGPQWIFYNTTNSGIPSNDLGAIEIDSNNVKWIGSEQGLIRFDDVSWTLYNGSNSPVTARAMSFVKKDKDNSIWFSVDGLGLYHIKNGVFSVYNSSNSGLPSNGVYCIAIESDSIKWIGSGTKLAKYDNTTWTVFDTLNSGFQYGSLLCIEVQGHTKWFGHGLRGLAKYNDTTWSYYYTNILPGFDPGVVFSIFVENNNMIWLGTWMRGVYKFNTTLNQWSIYNTSNSQLYDNYVHGIFKNSSDGRLYCGLSSYGLSTLLDTTWSHYGSPFPIGASVINFKKDKYNNVWIPTYGGGLFVYNPNGVVGINDQSTVVKDFELSQNYPNPFNPTTSINYELPNSNFVSLKVFAINGKELETLVNQKQNAGSYSVTFNASNYPSGVYFYKLETNNFSETKKMILLK